MTRPTRWSYSSLATYEECPAKWKYSYVDKLPSPPSPAMERGTRLHAQCETILNDHSTLIADELFAIAPILDKLRFRQAISEKAWRLNDKWESVPSKSWLIGVIDVHFTINDCLHIYDFKSGKPYASHKKQLELYSLIGLSIFPEITEVKCGAIYIDSGKLSYLRTITRDEAEGLIPLWSERANKLFSDSTLLAKRGSGCYWCSYKDSIGGPCSAWKS